MCNNKSNVNVEESRNEMWTSERSSISSLNVGKPDISESRPPDFEEK